MAKCLVLGRTNAGKTMLVLSLAGYAGLKEITLFLKNREGQLFSARYPLAEAMAQLVGPDPHLTRTLQVLKLCLPAGKGEKEVELIDTPGLMEGIHPEPSVRRAVALTLSTLREAEIILHIIDAVAQEVVTPVDREVAGFARERGRYAILANKMDLPGARRGLQEIKKSLPGNLIMPISALRQQGLREVKNFVVRQA